MPKRGGRSRGGSRGGRGGSRGGGSAGGSFSSFNLSKSSKRRARKNKAAAHGHRDVPELMDLGADGYVPEMGNSMHSLSKRPHRRMMDEARYTDKHAETMSQPLRYRRIEFVKAQGVYDPGKELIESLKKYDQKEKDHLSSDLKKLNVKQRTPEHSETIEHPETIDSTDSTEPIDSTEPTRLLEPREENDIETTEILEIPETAQVPEIIEATQNFSIQDSPEAPKPQELFEGPEQTKNDYKFETAPTDSEVESSNVGSIPNSHPAVKELKESEHRPVITEATQTSLPEDYTCGVYVQEDQSNDGTPTIQNEFSGPVYQEQNEHYDEQYGSDNESLDDVEMLAESDQDQGLSQESDVYIEGEEEHDAVPPALEDFFTIDETGDNEVFHKHSVQKKPTASVLKSVYSQKVSPKPYHKTPKSEPATEHDSYLMVGNVMLKTSKDEFGNVSADFPRAKRLQGSTTLSNFPEDYDEEESEDSDDEAAFEDYKAQIMGDFDSDDDDDDDSEDDDIAEDFADLDDGVIFDYANRDKGGPKKFQYYDDSDVYISSDEDGDMSGDDLDEQYLNSDEEGLEDILAFARNQQKIQKEIDIPPTQTLKKKGKGKKQRLELGSHLELELRESLMEQFQYQKQSKKDKKLRKKEKRQREGIELHDLKIKYDYSLHIQEIKSEFETFLHDAGRETMSFPPLDGHGNKTINKLAGHYNMKCIRSGGNGLNLFMKVAKTKKTFRYVPAYDQIGYIMKQRPVFKRVDVKPRTKEEIAETDGKKDRSGPKNNAIVREGDIVGGKAPEIGNNNIGRQLLEKLGWVKGEGLGALGNKGISEPLTATVKRSKTGLK
ncbi:hypothetical protein JCM33374_g483 [Metschnikowia sp. JCM 33374]|nr:hypothetical protein JCM33374_g483 [Metschnikowia sp. JCM 33374]